MMLTNINELSDTFEMNLVKNDNPKGKNDFEFLNNEISKVLDLVESDS